MIGFIKTPMTDKNDFKMPFLKTPKYAADQIFEGLVNKNTFEIHFPKSLTITLKLLSFLPNKIYFGLVGKLTKYQKKQLIFYKIDQEKLQDNFLQT